VYHLSTLKLTVRQTFFNGIIAFKSLSRPAFGIHQAAIFPVYFSLQSFLPILVALTGLKSSQSAGDATNILSHLYWCMATVSIAGLINLIIFRPLTRNAVEARNLQGLMDRRGNNPHFISPEKKALDRRFKYIHATSICINFGGLIATGQYGSILAKLLD
ncbi:hypothetical protein N7495_002758, partial [Penicillium taxi]|uniref:uncharacterized protein n=1 Tax=Penicillium taxi TaxID=168475 RepID=UPI002545928D